jgi:ATP-dependent Lon protease
VGGELLTIEAVTVPGKGQVKTTGKLGEVMKESIQAAWSFVKARAPIYGIKPSPLRAQGHVHIHLPEGAVPKDGPSAGIGMVTAIVSTLTGIPVRRDVAMTGEVTLRGRVLPIGGLKEKLLAALRGGIKTVLIPAGKRKGSGCDIPANIVRPSGLEMKCPSAMSTRCWQRLNSALVNKQELIRSCRSKRFLDRGRTNWRNRAFLRCGSVRCFRIGRSGPCSKGLISGLDRGAGSL